MIEDYFKTLTKRVFASTSDGAAGTTSTNTDTSFQGAICTMKGWERLQNMRIGTNATLKLITETTLDNTNQVIDPSNGEVLDVVYAYPADPSGYLYYDLKKINI